MGLAIFGVDRAVAHWFGEQTLAPVLAMLCFACLVFVGSPNLVLLAIPLFAVECFFLIKGHSQYPHVRTGSLVVGGLVAYWACRQRRDLIERTQELDLILSKLRTPWVLCDHSGNIRRLSVSAAEMVQAHIQDLPGTSFFAKFSAGPSKGELVQKFLRASDNRTPVEKVGLSLSNHPDRLLDASFIPVQSSQGSGILVILSSPPA